MLSPARSRVLLVLCTAMVWGVLAGQAWAGPPSQGEEGEEPPATTGGEQSEDPPVQPEGEHSEDPPAHQEGEEGEDAPPPTQQEPAPPQASKPVWLDRAGRAPAADPEQRAAQVRALIDGTLDPLIDSEAVLDASSPELVDATMEGPLRDALAAFAALGPEARAQRLEQHAARRRLALLGDAWVQRIRAKADEFDRRDRDIRRFLGVHPAYGLARGTVAPTPIDLLALVASRDELEPLELPPPEVDEAEARRNKRRRPKKEQEEPVVPPEPRSSPEVRGAALAELELARARLRKSARALADLEPEQRRALQDRQRYFDVLRRRRAQAIENGESQDVEEVARAEAAKASREREKALLDAENAKTERERRHARAKADILAVQAVQATARADLEQDRDANDARGEMIDELLARAASVVEAAESPTAEPSEDPDELYAELSAALDEERQSLREAMGRVRKPPTIATGELVSEEELTPELIELRKELIAEGTELNREAEELEWTRADVIFAEVEDLNEARLEVLRVASRSLRASVRGFGPPGVRAVKLEIEQITLTLRYRAGTYSRTVEELRASLAHDWPYLIFGLLKVAAVILAIVWWRRRADSLLSRAMIRLRELESDWAPLARRGLWYVVRIRKPLEWLVVFTVLLEVLHSAFSLPSLTLLLIATRWLCIGSASILLIDAIASRSTSKADPLAQLRIRSIRLVGLTVVWIGLFMALVEALVGRGAIHAWSWRICWLALIPVLILLTRWWRDEVLERLRTDRATGAIIEWAQRRSATRAGAVLVGALGVRYLGQAISRMILRRASRFDLTRRVLAFLVKREVQKKAEADAAVATLPGLEPQLLARITGSDLDGTDVPSYALEEITRVKETLEERDAATAVIIGERGLGKSMFLQRLGEAFGDDRIVISVRCTGSTFTHLLAQIAKELDVEPQRQAVREALTKGDRLRVVLVDDVHRLVRPAMGGLKELDRFIKFIHRIESGVDWACSFGKEAWAYVERSRSVQVFFDQMIELPEWTEVQLGELIGQRCLANGFAPDFSRVTVPSRFDDEQLEDEERARRGIVRLLWDYSNGNPMVALHFWGESLCRGEEGEVQVRLFQTPESATIDRLAVDIQFVLRALVQLEEASARQLAECTRLSQGVVRESVRFIVAQGYAYYTSRYKVRVSVLWFRAVTESLRRQHLLPR